MQTSRPKHRHKNGSGPKGTAPPHSGGPIAVGMSRGAVARSAQRAEAQRKAEELYGAQVRAALKKFPTDPARSAGNTTKGKLQ